MASPTPQSTLRAPNLNPVVAPEAQLPQDHVLVMKVIPRTSDANANGDIFGGWVMSQVDIAGSILTARHAQGRQATVAVNQFIFKQPVRVGDIVSLYAKMKHIGRTSMTVNVEAYTERLGTQGRFIKVTEATLTYVAIDDNGHPREVPLRDLGAP